MGKEIKYSENERLIVEALAKATDGLTIAEVREVTGVNVQPGSFTSLVKKGHIEVAGEKEVMRPGHKEVTLYSFATNEAGLNIKGEPYTYSEKEQSLIKIASAFEGEFTLAELSEAYGSPVATGTLTSLVKKGNFSKNPEKQIVEVQVPGTVKVYAFVSPIEA